MGDGNAADDEEHAVTNDADGPVEGALDEHAGAQGTLLLSLLPPSKNTLSLWYKSKFLVTQ